MSLYARMNGDVVAETFRHSSDPTPLFDPSWVWIECPPETVQGSLFDGSTWVHPEPAAPEPVVPAPTYKTEVSPVEFKMLFEPAERIAIRVARGYQGDDAEQAQVAMVLDDWWSIVDDPRLTAVNLGLPQTQAGLDFLVAIGILTAERRAEIGLGLPETPPAAA